MLKRIKEKRQMGILFGTLVLATILYLLHFKYILILATVALYVAYFPLPRVIGSVFSRVFFATLIYFSVIQVASLVQFVLFPHSGFDVLAIIVTLFSFTVLTISLLFKWTTPNVQLRWFDRRDMVVVIAIIMSMIAFTPILAGRSSIVKIATIGSGQAIDATNHFAFINEMSVSGHLDYAKGHYYPKGFHISMGYIQNSIFGANTNLGWRGNAILYFVQYLFMIATLCATAVYFVLAIADRALLASKWWLLSVAISLGLTLATFFTLPFMEHGFLNFYYVCAAILAGFTLLLSGERRMVESAGYLVLAFGAGYSWPLLTPLLVVVFLMYVFSTGLFEHFKTRTSFVKLIVLILLLLQATPIVLQLLFSSGDPSQGLNQTGDLRVFRVANVLLATIITITLPIFIRNKRKERVLSSILLPTVLFVVALAAFQYLTLGEVRYYVIKCAFIMEIITLGIMFGICIDKGRELKAFLGSTRVFALLLIPPLIFFTTIAISGPPFTEIRNLFRSATHQTKPQYFDQDISIYTRLGSEGKINDFNSTVLHYNADDGKYYGHMQLAFWSNMMSYSGTTTAEGLLMCNGQLYNNLSFGTFTKEEQKQLVEKINDCATHYKTYYIITDPASVEHIRSIVAKNVTIVSK